MEENKVLIDKLAELNQLEIDKSKILYYLFNKTAQKIFDNKVQLLESNLELQAKYYNQKLSSYKESYEDILNKFKEQLSQIIQKYSEPYINMQLELQEAQCNQKIAITNLKKSYDIKKEVTESNRNALIEEYTKKMEACSTKVRNYNIIIDECEKELSEYINDISRRIDSLFSDENSQLIVRNDSIIQKIVNKITNIFVGSSNFKKYVIDPINIELEMRDGKLLEVSNDITREAIKFVAKIKQAKDETNRIFDSMIQI